MKINYKTFHMKHDIDNVSLFLLNLWYQLLSHLKNFLKYKIYYKRLIKCSVCLYNILKVIHFIVQLKVSTSCQSVYTCIWHRQFCMFVCLQSPGKKGTFQPTHPPKNQPVPQVIETGSEPVLLSLKLWMSSHETKVKKL